MKTVLIFLILLVAVLAYGYGEKKCIERTTHLSCSDFSVIYNTIDEAIRSIRPEPELATTDPSSTLIAGKLVAGIVRLAFHDAVEHDPKSQDKFRSDGCVNLNDPGNGGLDRVIKIVNGLWAPFCDKISRADFWYLAAKVAIETSCPYTDHDNSLGAEGSKKKRSISQFPRITYFNIPFYYGRQSTENCSYSGPSRLPNADGTSNEFRRVFFNHLGLNVRETTALLGAHTLGSLSVVNSGYNGIWKGRTDLFDTEYFYQLVINKWQPQILTSPAGKVINQWSIVNATAENSNIVMLNTDMDLLYNIDPKESRKNRQTCGPYDPTSKTDGCQHIDRSYSNSDFNYYALKYFEGHQVNDQDLPGSARFLHDFARAFNKMCTAGYTKEELTCAECVTPSCEDCKRKVLCEGPHYGKFASQNDYEEKNEDDDDKKKK